LITFFTDVLMETGLSTGFAVLIAALAATDLVSLGAALATVTGLVGLAGAMLVGLLVGSLASAGLMGFAGARRVAVGFTLGSVVTLAPGFVSGMDSFLTGLGSFSELEESAAIRLTLAATGLAGAGVNLTGELFGLTTGLPRTGLTGAILVMTGLAGGLLVRDVVLAGAAGDFLRTVSGFSGLLGATMVVCFAEPIRESGLPIIAGFFKVAIFVTVSITARKVINFSRAKIYCTIWS